MVKDSLKKQLRSFPYLFDKSPNSNFYKIQSVFNKQFQKLDQSLFEVYESFKLDKCVLIWKEQSVPYVYTMKFVANFPNLKSVKIYKNDELIYSHEFNYEDNVNTFDYSYEQDTRNDVLTIEDNESEDENNSIQVEADIIPQDTFLLLAETYDEHIIQKGFPENDVKQNNFFDHDESLDEIGVLNNIPRKEYIETNDYENTEPQFNDRLTEDDYHYMKRQLEYLLKIQEVPLPVAEIFKLYGLEATMLNRERLLLKMFDLKKHGYINHEGDLYVDSWEPEPWEHKDGFCGNAVDLGKLFFVNANTVTPMKFTDVIFNFKILNIYGQPVDMEYTVEIFLDNIPITTCSDSAFKISTDDLDEINVNLFKFKAFDNEGELIGEQEIEINVKGCNDGDFYVRYDGDDDNDGSKDYPFFTIKKAIDSLNSNQNLIVVSGEIYLDDLHIINKPCTILGCNNGTISSPLNHNKFFNILKDIEVTLSDLTLSHNYAVHYSRVDVFKNKNGDLGDFETVIIHGGLPVLTLNANQENYYHLYDNVILSFSLNSLAGNPLKFTALDLYIDDEFFTTVYTDINGNGTITLNNQNINPLSVEYKLKFNETDVFYETDIEKLVNLTKSPTRIDCKYGRLQELSAEYDSSANLYENGELIHNASFEEGALDVTYLPDYGEHIVYFSEDGIHVIKEWIINSRFYISDLEVPYLVTDVTLDNESELYVTFTPLADFTKVEDLENVIVNLELDDGKLYKEYFQLTNLDSKNGDELYPEDLVNFQQAIVNVLMEDGCLEIERIDTIILEEEE